MRISEALEQAWALLQQPGACTLRAPARNGELEAVHALHESATCWDSVGAIQKVLGEMAGETFDHALLCLRIGALKVSPPVPGGGGGLGVIEIHDSGDVIALRLMWRHAIQAAQRVEHQFPQATA